MVSVSIIVLNYNQAKLTVDCIKSLLKQTYKSFEILIIDNNSKDCSYDIFKKTFKGNKKIRVFQTGKNTGYAGGNNFGVKKSEGKYIAILNNDTVVKKDWLHWLVKGLESDPKVKVVGAEMPIYGRTDQILDYKWYNLTKTLTGFTVFYKYKKPLKNTDFLNVFSAGGCAFIYDKSVMELPFPDEYFIYSEDTYFNWVVQLMGYKVLKATKAYGDHFHNTVKKSGDKKLNSYFSFLAERNLHINLFIMFSLKNTIKILPLIFLKMILRNAMEPRKIPYHLKAYLWLLFHPGYLHRRRKYIKSIRKVDDDKIISRMSYDFYDSTKMYEFRKALIFFNKLSGAYCKLVRLKTIEFSQ